VRKKYRKRKGAKSVVKWVVMAVLEDRQWVVMAVLEDQLQGRLSERTQPPFFPFYQKTDCAFQSSAHFRGRSSRPERNAWRTSLGTMDSSREKGK
jgi:hypothetical protein